MRETGFPGLRSKQRRQEGGGYRERVTVTRLPTYSSVLYCLHHHRTQTLLYASEVEMHRFDFILFGLTNVVVDPE